MFLPSRGAKWQTLKFLTASAHKEDINRQKEREMSEKLKERSTKSNNMGAIFGHSFFRIKWIKPYFIVAERYCLFGNTWELLLKT